MNRKIENDFNWDTYTNDYYAKQIDEMQEGGTEFVLKQSYVDNGRIIFKENIHPFMKELCNEILQFKPASVFECGCGSGQHLFNIRKLFPDIKVAGCELLKTQVDLGIQKFGIPSSIINNIKVIDFCNFIIKEKYEFVYTNAVIMHLYYEKALMFIKKMKECSLKYIRLYEDIGQHDFMELFSKAGIMNEFKIQEESNGYFLERSKCNEC